VAIFWVAWAFVAEKAENFPFAEKVFKKAIEKEVEPQKFIQERYKQFNRRMSRHWLNSQKTDNDFDSSREEEDQGRGTLMGLTESGARMNQRSRRANPTIGPNDNARDRGTGNGNTNSRGSRPNMLSNSGQSSFGGRVDQMNNASRSRSKRPGTEKGFAIFVEENQNNPDELDDRVSTCQRPLEREAERKKENKLEAEEWNKRGGLDNPYIPRGGARAIASTNAFAIRAAPAPVVKPFEVFVDEDCKTLQKEKQAQKVTDEQAEQKRHKPSMRERLGDGVVSH
jgi:hypothetical protein